jgi:CheY-like chemotaxis protein
MTTTRILLVEDSTAHVALITKSIKIKLEDSVSIDIAGSLRECIAKLPATVYDCIILDLVLPDSQGYDTLSSIREMVNDVPIIVCTSINDCRVKLQSLAGGASAYVEKDGKQEGELAAMIVSVLWQHRRQTDLSKSINDRLDAIHSILTKSTREHENFREEIDRIATVIFGDDDCTEDCGLIGQVHENTKTRKFWSKIGWIIIGSIITLATSGIVAVATHIINDTPAQP